MAKATFGAGCFWGIESAFRQVKGVTDVAVGYATDVVMSWTLITRIPPLPENAEANTHSDPGTTTRSSGDSWPQMN